MTNIPPNPNTVSNLLTTHAALVTTLVSFLTVFIHHTLYLRRIYPPVSFLSTRAYNYPVRQNRHPEVCKWILDAVALVKDQLERNTVQNVAICIFECDENRVLERWVVNLHNFPVVEKREQNTPFDTPGPLQQPPDEPTTTNTNRPSITTDPKLHRPLNLLDLESHFRAILSRLSTSSSKLTPLPSGPAAPEYSFTLTMEVKDTADRPVGRVHESERAWIPAEPEPFADADHVPSSDEDDDLFIGPRTSTKRRNKDGKTHPVRRLEAGELRMEVWVEESREKFQMLEGRSFAKSTQADDELPEPAFSNESGYDDIQGMDTHKAQPPNVATGYRR